MKRPRSRSRDPAIAQIEDLIAKQKIDTTSSSWRSRLRKPPEIEFADGRQYFWMLKTNVGPIRIELFPQDAPMHVSSTMYLTMLGFYDGLSFHRVISSFMVQGGCPNGTGEGGPGYSYDGKFDSQRRHDKAGMVSMANKGPGTDGSQFFITFKAAPWLDGRHTIFGRVVEGMDTVREMEAKGNAGGTVSPETLKIFEASISTR
jgi:cyclophilin family peptidyl-prolyl cis-trans isomerase